MAKINYRDPRPIFEQIADQFREQILTGELAEGAQLPSVRSLAMELATNPNTVQKAYAALERDGFCYSVRGRGSFVCDNALLLDKKKEQLRQKIAVLLAEAESLGIPREEIIPEKGSTHD